MTSRKVEVLVGLFVAMAIAASLMLALNVASRGSVGQGDTYTLYAKFENIGGLKVRSPVKVGGVTIGRVNAIKLDKDDYSPVVELTIQSEYTEFPETISASILTSGLLGEQYIGFEPGFTIDGVENLAEGDYIEDTS